MSKQLFPNPRLLFKVAIIYFSIVFFIGFPSMYAILFLITDLLIYIGIEWVMYTGFGFIFVIISFITGMKISEKISEQIIFILGFKITNNTN